MLKLLRKYVHINDHLYSSMQYCNSFSRWKPKFPSKMTIWYHPEGFWCLYWAVFGSFVWLCQFSWKWQVKNVSLKMAIFPTQMLVQRLKVVIILKNIIENLSLAQKMPKIFRNVHPWSHFSWFSAFLTNFKNAWF